MKINIIAIGKIKEKYFSDAINEYVKRCSRFAEVKIIELPDAPPSKSPDEQRKIESEQLLSKAKGFVIATDMRGKQCQAKVLPTSSNPSASTEKASFPF